MNGFGGNCRGAGENILSSVGGFDGKRAMFCAAAGGLEAGETVGTCLGIPVGMGVESGNCGLLTSVGSTEASGVALLFRGAGLIVFGGVKGGVMDADGGVVAV